MCCASASCVSAVLHTPGHTPEHLSYVLYDEAREASQPLAIFSGDFLFVGSLRAAPTCWVKKRSNNSRAELYRSLHNRIAHLPDGVQVYPGHGAGSLCGSGMSERAESTLGYERLTQPMFSMQEETFVREILESVPPMPSYYPRMKELNAKGASSMASLPGGNAIAAARVAGFIAEPSVTVVDLRRPEAFGGAHIPGALNLGAGQNLSLWAGWLLAPDQRLLLVNDKGEDEEARRSLVRVGLDNIEGFLEAGMPTWIDAGMDFKRTTQLSTRDVAERSDGTRILDVRSDKEWVGGHIEGATHIPLGELRSRTGELPRESSIIAVCGSGYRSSIAASLLQAAGFFMRQFDGWRHVGMG